MSAEPLRLPVYLDYAATTPVDPRVAEVMVRCLSGDELHANPASGNHAPGRRARAVVEGAREQVAALVGARPREIVWTSGATESDNLAIRGAACFHRERGRHLVTVRTEHRAVIDTCRQLEREGFDVTWLVPDRDGIVTPQQLAGSLRDDTVLTSIMLVNNETGVIQDIAALGAICRQREVMFHVDAAQAVGRLPIDLARLPVDLMSFSAHKAYGPKGIGALYVRDDPRVLIEPLIYGGGQERGLRPGTLATHQSAGMGAAFRLAGETLDEDAKRISALCQRLWEGIADLPRIMLNGHPTARAGGFVNVSFDGVEGESLLFALRELAVSSGSACSSASSAPSYVLRALGREDHLAQSSVRFSLGRFTTVAEVDFAIRTVREQVQRLRALAPG